MTTTYRVQSLDSLYQEMLAVARGEQTAPSHAAESSVHSADVIVRLLTPENRELLATIRERRPASVTQLAAWTGRAGPNLGRTLEKLEAVGLIEYEYKGRRKAPRAVDRTFVFTIDPYSVSGDRVQLCDRARAARSARPAGGPPADEAREERAGTSKRAATSAAGGRQASRSAANRPAASRPRPSRSGTGRPERTS